MFGVRKFLCLTTVLALLPSNPKELVEKTELQAPLEGAICAISISVELKDCFQARKRWSVGARAGGHQRGRLDHFGTV